MEEGKGKEKKIKEKKKRKGEKKGNEKNKINKKKENKRKEGKKMRKNKSDEEDPCLENKGKKKGGCNSLCSDSRKSLVQEIKLVYSTSVMSRCQKQKR